MIKIDRTTPRSPNYPPDFHHSVVSVCIRSVFASQSHLYFSWHFKTWLINTTVGPYTLCYVSGHAQSGHIYIHTYTLHWLVTSRFPSNWWSVDSSAFYLRCFQISILPSFVFITWAVVSHMEFNLQFWDSVISLSTGIIIVIVIWAQIRLQLRYH